MRRPETEVSLILMTCDREPGAHGRSPICTVSAISVRVHDLFGSADDHDAPSEFEDGVDGIGFKGDPCIPNRRVELRALTGAEDH